MDHETRLPGVHPGGGRRSSANPTWRIGGSKMRKGLKINAGIG